MHSGAVKQTSRIGLTRASLHKVVKGMKKDFDCYRKPNEITRASNCIAHSRASGTNLISWGRRRTVGGYAGGGGGTSLRPEETSPRGLITNAVFYFPVRGAARLVHHLCRRSFCIISRAFLYINSIRTTTTTVVAVIIHSSRFFSPPPPRYY